MMYPDALFRSALMAAAGTILISLVHADEPKTADPVAAAMDPDFLVQGEYLGDRQGMQVVLWVRRYTFGMPYWVTPEIRGPQVRIFKEERFSGLNTVRSPSSNG